MAEDSKLIPRESGTNGAIDLVPLPSRLPAWNLSPHEPHLYDYLLILRKHQWLILSFMLAVVTITAIGTFRMQPVYVATSRIEIDRKTSNILRSQPPDSYNYMMNWKTTSRRNPRFSPAKPWRYRLSVAAFS